MANELGKVGLGDNGGKYIGWKEWLEKSGRNPSDLVGTYAVIRVWPPNRFPTATLVFWVDDPQHPEGGYGVKKTIPPQLWAALERVGFTPGKVRKGGTLYLDFAEGEMKILLEEDSGVYVPVPSGGWELQ